jgi:16S rRNA (guanine(1405)-N(7))-methyltransferase
MLEPSVAEVVRGLLDSRKYRHLSLPTLVRVARWALRGHPHPQEALKAAKRKLHQVYSAYLQPQAVGAAQQAAQQLESRALPSEEQRAICLDLLGQHASTAERLPFLERFYSEIFAGLPPVRSVHDLACGLNPFALPWMPLAEGAEYLAVDVDERLTAVFDRLGSVWPVWLRGHTHDLAGGPLNDPGGPADVVLLLKAIPCLEQQEAGAGWGLLDSLDVPCVVVSFPARSLGGRDKGMQQTYDRRLREKVRGSGRPIEAWAYPTEVVYRLR